MSLSRALGLLLLPLILQGCLPGRSTEQATDSRLPEAQRALTSFFNYLHDGHYTEAEALYGGTHEFMRDWNPDIPPDDLPQLMRRACQQNGIMCLKPMAVFPQGKQEQSTYSFTVQFANDDGSLFVRRPCCGASTTDEPPQSEFEFEVVEDPQGVFLVQEMPPYVP
jgi:hypothetical protein